MSENVNEFACKAPPRSRSVKTIKGCSLFHAWFSDQTDERKELIRDRVKNPAYVHLFPCAKANGGWGYKKDCAKCKHAIIVEE